MSGYTKLFSSILASTIWRTDNPTRLLWITMLAMTDRFGCVYASVPGLADFARISLEECERGLAALQSPDPYSRTKDFEGRRLMPIDGGWHIVNFDKFRKLLNEEERREYLKLKQREYRAKHKQESTPVDNVSNESTPLTHALPYPEADPDPEVDQNTSPNRTSRSSPLASPRKTRAAVVYPLDFIEFWKAYPKRTGKGAALKAWGKAQPPIGPVLEALGWQRLQPAWTRDKGQFIPHPSTWLNRRSWEDEPFHPPVPKTTAQILAEGRTVKEPLPTLSQLFAKRP